MFILTNLTNILTHMKMPYGCLLSLFFCLKLIVYTCLHGTLNVYQLVVYFNSTIN